MNRIKVTITLLMVFMLQSCIDLGIYVSDFPLGPPESATLVPNLDGIWENTSESENGKEARTIEFVLFNSNEYLIRSGSGSEQSLVRAFSTTVAGVDFLNFQDLSESKKEFIFCKFQILSKNKMILHFIADTLFKSEKPSSPKKLRKFIKKNLKNRDLFNHDMKYTFKRLGD